MEDDEAQQHDEKTPEANEDALPEFERVQRDNFLAGLGEHDPKGDIRWVFQALGSDGLKPEDAPSAGAWAYFCQLKEDQMMRKDFYRTVAPKLLPSKSQLDKGDDRVDDGRKLFGIIERLLREPDDDAPVLSDVEKRAVKNGTRQLALSATGS